MNERSGEQKRGPLGDGPVVKTLVLPLQGEWVQFLVGKLRSRMTRGQEAQAPQQEKPACHSKDLAEPNEANKTEARPVSGGSPKRLVRCSPQKSSEDKVSAVTVTLT